MRKIQFFLFALASLFLTNCTSGTKDVKSNSELASKDTSLFDAELAKKTGADEYGMKPYVIAFLKAGPIRDQDSVAAANLQKAHMDNIGRMAEDGSLVVAGPFMDDTELKGIYIFNVATIEEAKKLTETDPAVKAGRLIMELHPWYSSAALVEINSMHKKIAKKGF